MGSLTKEQMIKMLNNRQYKKLEEAFRKFKEELRAQHRAGKKAEEKARKRKAEEEARGYLSKFGWKVKNLTVSVMAFIGKVKKAFYDADLESSESDSCTDSTCCICLGDRNESKWRNLPTCMHGMHESCYKKLLRNGGYSCPLCRADF